VALADGKRFAAAELPLDLVLWEAGTSSFSSDSKLKFLGVCEPPARTTPRTVARKFDHTSSPARLCENGFAEPC
jgi:hypothetical protein